MTITTLAGVNSGLQMPQVVAKLGSAAFSSGREYSSWFLPGQPAAGVVDTTTSGGVARSSTSALVTGQIPHYDPPSGNAYIARLVLSANTAAGPPVGACLGMLADRLWECGHDDSLNAAFGFGAVTNTITTSATWPARDDTGSTNGQGVYIGLEVSTAMGNPAIPTYTLTYTNSAGAGSKTATNIFATANSPPVGTFYRFGLASGDVGVKSVQSVAASSTQTSGQFILVAYRVLCPFVTPGSGAPGSNIGPDALVGCFPRIYNGAVPFFLWQSNAGAIQAVVGRYMETQG